MTNTLTMLALVFAQPGQLQAGDHTQTIEVDKRSRAYLVHIPPKYDPKKPTRVVLAFHGGGSNAEMMWAFFEKHPMKTGDGEAKMVRVLFADKMVQPERDVPKEAQEQRPKPGEFRGPFSKLVAGKLSSVTVTYFNTKMLKEKKDTEEFLRRLLTTPKGSAYIHVPWAQSLALPTVTAIVEHAQGKEGTWLIWDGGQSVYCAYKDGSGRWWFGVWFQNEIPR